MKCTNTKYLLLSFSGTRLSLDAIKRRLQTSNKYTKDELKDDQKIPLFSADVVLQIPNVVMKPSLDDLQHSLNKAVQVGALYHIHDPDLQFFR